MSAATKDASALLRHHISKIVNAAPPLNADQRARIVALLSSGGAA